MAGMSSDADYRAPGWFTRNVFNRIVAAATRVGISVWGSRVLEVRGRKSGVPFERLSTDAGHEVRAKARPSANSLCLRRIPPRRLG